MRVSAKVLSTVGLVCGLAAAAGIPARADEVPTAAVVAVAAPVPAADRQSETVGLTGSGTRAYPLPQFHLADTARSSSLPTRPILYALQLVDAIQSGHGRRLGAVETNPMVKPFSHGGAATYALGFAIGDVLRSAIFHRAPKAVSETADSVQAMTNLDGIISTHATLSQLAR